MERVVIKVSDFYYIIIGALTIFAGIVLNNIMPWADQINLIHIEKCIADMHFRNINETDFQKCVTPNLKHITATQQLIAIITVLYTIGGVFVGFGFKTISKSQSKKSINKLDVCNCGTVLRCPIHDRD